MEAVSIPILDEKYELFKRGLSADVISSPEKISMLLEKMEEFMVYANSVSHLDIQLIETLKSDLSSRTNDTIHSKDFSEKIDDIDDDATIIFLKNAEIFKVYNPEELMNEFTNHVNTTFKNKGPVFEVIRDMYPQKLIIIIDDDIRDRLQIVKKHLIDFLKQNTTYDKVDESDIVVYGNDGKTEFLATNVILKNITERTKFTENFIRYMQLKEKVIASKIQLHPPMSEVTGVKFYKLPREKEIISGDTRDVLNHLITKIRVDNSSTIAPVIVNLTVNNNHIVNSTVNSKVNSDNTKNKIKNSNTNVTNVKVAKAHKKTLKTFYKHIFDTRPNWYVENAMTEMEHIADAYKTYFNDQISRTTDISKRLKGGIFLTGTRTSGVIYKKLVTYNELQKLF